MQMFNYARQKAQMSDIVLGIICEMVHFIVVHLNKIAALGLG